MKSLICSDIHDHIGNLEEALGIAATAGCTSVLCCGDLCAPFVLDVFDTLKTASIHIVFGNNDGDRFLMQRRSDLLNATRTPETRIILHGEYLLANINHTLPGIPPTSSLAMTHYPDLAQALGKSDLFDLICCGHSHRSSIEKTERGYLVNPGSVMGFVPGPTGGIVKHSALIVNWKSGELELLEW